MTEPTLTRHPGSQSNRRSAVLECRLGSETTVVRVAKDRVVFGSVVSADVLLRGETVSPIHAVLEFYAKTNSIGADGMLFDLASDSGVEVNGKKIVSHPLKSGDEIRIGSYRIGFRVEEPSVQVAEPAVSLGAPDMAVSPDASVLFRPAKDAHALEAVLSWKGTILDVRHLPLRGARGQGALTIGPTGECTFLIPPMLGSTPFRLVETSPAGNTLHLDPKMQGVLHTGGEVKALAGMASGTVPFGVGDFAKFKIGEVDFYLSYTEAPPRLRRTGLEKDQTLRRTLALSLAVMLLLLRQISQIEVSRQIEIEELPERIVRILYQPEKYSSRVQPLLPPVTKVEIQPQMTTPTEVPKTMRPQSEAKIGEQNQAKQRQAQQQAKEGTGARKKGAEGSRGRPNAATGKEQQAAAMRPGTAPGPGRGGNPSEVGGHGNLQVLKGVESRIQNLLGSTLSRMGKTGEKLKGFGAFDTRGNEGEGLTGTGSGGGGTSEGLGGLADKGIGGGRVGTGLGASGTGSHIIGGKTRVALQRGGPEETVVLGSIDKAAIEAAILKHRDEFLLCYNREINAGNPRLSGRILTSFVIGSQGRVTEAGVAQTTMNHAPTERCVITVLRRIDFPIPMGGGIVQVTYPFKFRPVGGG